jgi:hypothetical protein
MKHNSLTFLRGLKQMQDAETRLDRERWSSTLSSYCYVDRPIFHPVVRSMQIKV